VQFTTASWIWHPAREKMDNFYLYARRSFSLEGAPSLARILVTASSLYKLYVNGEYVGRGPNPSDPSRYYYDVHDVTGLLRAGENVIAAVCYNYGAEANGILGQNWGRGGLLLELQSGEEGDTLLATDSSWRVLHAPAWDQGAAVNCTLLGDYKEIYDSRKEIEGWFQPGFDDSPWIAPEVLGPIGTEPWTTLVEREIPFLDGQRVYPVNAAWESASVTYAWRDDWEVYHEQSLVPRSAQKPDSQPARVFKTHDDFTPSIMLDFGRDVTGYPEIHIANSNGGVIDVLYAEDAYFVRVDRFLLKGGAQVLQPFGRRTFRYMKLQFPETPTPVDIREVSMKMDTFPVEYRGEFECSDDKLSRIWDTGRYTMHMSMLDHFVDCPWRERTLYGGDVYAENLIAHYAFGDPRMNRKCLRQMFAIQYDEGALPPYGPYRGCHGFYPAWSAYWGLAFVDHYWLTADCDFLQELWPAFSRLMDWTIGQLDANDNGLMGAPSESLKFPEWMKAPKVAFSPSDNFPFQVLLRRGGELASRLGQADTARRYEEASQALAGALKKHLVAPESGMVTDGVRGQRHRSGQYHAGLLLWSGIPDEGWARRVAHGLFDSETSRIGAPFHALFVTEGLFGSDEDHLALDFIRRFWGNMLDRGATTYWDNFSLDWPPQETPDRQNSLCHGWAAGATYSLPAHVLGVRPLEPGFAKVLIEPRPADLDWARGSVPAPQGLVEVSWAQSATRFHLDVCLPQGCEGVVSLPKSARGEITVDGQVVKASSDGARAIVEISSGRHRICRLA
jgi:alpha-L-rhamnosidase